jgi:hypothetical protein
VRIKNSEQLTKENNTLRNNTFYLIIRCLYGNFFGPEKMSIMCGKMTGMMDRGFTVVQNLLLNKLVSNSFPA